jgi:S-adenosylmethionine:tRNA ribosyltransferase-isomerase
VRAADFDFDLPDELIAQRPVAERDQSRLLVLDRRTSTVSHRHFSDLTDFFAPGDVLVLNNSRVIRARLHAVNANSGGAFELLLLEENALNDWWVMLRPGKRGSIGTQMVLREPGGRLTGITATVLETNPEGHRRVSFSGASDIKDALDQIGTIPLPPYIARAAASTDAERYQTVYAAIDGSVAAPTAGLHFTEPVLERVGSKGVEVCFVTLHVGLGTFAPVKSEDLAGHTMHEERFEVPEQTAAAIRRAKQDGRRVVGVGTTTVRVLESVAQANHGELVAGGGRNPDIHPSAIFLSDSGRTGHQFPPAAFHLADVGERVCLARATPRPGVRSRRLRRGG